MNAYWLSVVVAVKEWCESDIQRLVCSLSSQPLASKIQLVVVYSNKSPESAIADLDVSIGSVKYLQNFPRGVYAAFTAGVGISDGDYILFSGGDDFFMPGLNKVLSTISEGKGAQPDVIVSPVCFGDERLLLPVKTRLGIVLKNWCQQGVLYRKDIFDKYHFDDRYPIQADHKFNIELLGSSELTIHYSNYISAYFSCGGMSQTKPDLCFWRDMPSIVSTNFGWAYAVICRIRKIVGYILYGSPEQRFKVPK